MKFSTGAVEKMAEIMVQEMNKIDAEGQRIRCVETRLRELLREVGAQALGNYLEQQDEQLQEQYVSARKERLYDPNDKTLYCLVG